MEPFGVASGRPRSGLMCLTAGERSEPAACNVRSNGLEEVEFVAPITAGSALPRTAGSIYVQTPTQEQVQIISISGAVLKNEQQVGLKQYTGLQRGIYIICIDEARFKVRL